MGKPFSMLLLVLSWTLLSTALAESETYGTPPPTYGTPASTQRTTVAAQFDQCGPNSPHVCPAGQLCKPYGGHYVCQCPVGSTLGAGGRCQRVSSCPVEPECDRNADCVQVNSRYTCQCRAGYVDVDPVTPGRECTPAPQTYGTPRPPPPPPQTYATVPPRPPPPPQTYATPRPPPPQTYVTVPPRPPPPPPQTYATPRPPPPPPQTYATPPPPPACPSGKMMNARGRCLYPGDCDPYDANSCDQYKRERCLPAPRQRPAEEKDETYESKNRARYGPTAADQQSTAPHEYTCQCVPGEQRDPNNGVCCLPGFHADASNPAQAVCIAPHIDAPPLTKQHNCGDIDCDVTLGEVCVNGRCLCKPGEGRARPTDKCEPLERTPLVFRVTSDGGKPLLFSSSEFGTRTSPMYVEFANKFAQELGKAASTTSYAPRYILTDVNYVNHPRTANTSWADGLLVNFTVGTRPTGTPVDACDLFNQLMESVRKTNGAIGGGQLSVAADNELLSPCPPPPKDLCGGRECRPELGEVCLNGEMCTCPPGQKRAGPDDHCRIVEAFTFPLWVIRNNQFPLECNASFANPLDSVHQQYSQSFQNGVRQSYTQTPMRDAFVTSEVNDILCPSVINGSWDHGVMFNTAYYYRVGSVPSLCEAYKTLVRWILDRNNQQAGQSGLYLSPVQPNPCSPCFKNDCHPKGICIETGPNSYRCECPKGYRDMVPGNAGHDCVPNCGINECENATLHQCSANARCIDLECLYRCDCLPGYVNSAPAEELPGSQCSVDFCGGVNPCPVNSTCESQANGPFCRCNAGFVDIRNVSEAVRVSAGLLPNQYCLLAIDINECLLGLDDCSDIAECIDLRIGYTCRCPANCTDADTKNPGRACSCALGLEAGHNLIPLLLFLILAALFLLLTLCCCLYMLSRLRCLKKPKQWDGYDQALTIPRARLDEDMGSLASSEYTIQEEVERRVTTEVTRTEQVGGETTFEEHEEVGDRHHTFNHGHGAAFRGGGSGANGHYQR